MLNPKKMIRLFGFWFTCVCTLSCQGKKRASVPVLRCHMHRGRPPTQLRDPQPSSGWFSIGPRFGAPVEFYLQEVCWNIYWLVTPSPSPSSSPTSRPISSPLPTPRPPPHQLCIFLFLFTYLLFPLWSALSARKAPYKSNLLFIIIIIIIIIFMGLMFKQRRNCWSWQLCRRETQWYGHVTKIPTHCIDYYSILIWLFHFVYSMQFMEAGNE